MRNRIAMIVATWFGSSMCFNVAPGTFGTIASVPLCGLMLYCLNDYGSLQKICVYSAIIAVVFILGLWSVPIAERVLSERKDGYGHVVDRDQGQIVIDETLGILIAGLPMLYISVFKHWQVPQTSDSKVHFG